MVHSCRPHSLPSLPLCLLFFPMVVIAPQCVCHARRLYPSLYGTSCRACSAFCLLLLLCVFFSFSFSSCSSCVLAALKLTEKACVCPSQHQASTQFRQRISSRGARSTAAHERGGSTCYPRTRTGNRRSRRRCTRGYDGAAPRGAAESRGHCQGRPRAASAEHTEGQTCDVCRVDLSAALCWRCWYC